MSERATKSPGFPADLFAVLVLPAIIIAMFVVGPQRTWIVLVFLGAFEIAAAALVLRAHRSSFSGWLYLAVGIVAVAAGIYFAFIPL